MIKKYTNAAIKRDAQKNSAFSFNERARTFLKHKNSYSLIN